MKRFKKRIIERYINPLLGFLKQGISPHKLALGISIGICLGLMPAVGTTTFLCFLVAIPLRLNLAAIQLANFLVYPVQIILIIPLIELGSIMLSVNPVPFTLVEMLELVNTNFMLAMNKLWIAFLVGVFAWLVIIVPFSFLSYLILKKSFIKISKQY